MIATAGTNIWRKFVDVQQSQGYTIAEEAIPRIAHVRFPLHLLEVEGAT